MDEFSSADAGEGADDRYSAMQMSFLTAACFPSIVKRFFF
jgi:hypothetical protein